MRSDASLRGIRPSGFRTLPSPTPFTGQETRTTRVTLWLACACLALTLLQPAAFAEAYPAQEGATALTVYRAGQSVARHYLEFEGTAEEQPLFFGPVSSLIDPTTARLVPIDSGFRVHEQSYGYDLQNEVALYSQYVGRSILWAPEAHDETTARSVRLLHFGRGFVVIADGERIITNPEGSLILPHSRELRLEPTLHWLIRTEESGPAGAELTYLTDGLSWGASHDAVLSPGEDSISIDTWVTITNRTGRDFADARIRLISGELHRVTTPWGVYPEEYALMRVAADAPAFGESQLFDYYVYDLERACSIGHGESKQLHLVTMRELPASKRYTFASRSQLGLAGSEGPQRVAIMIEFTAGSEEASGRSLPTGPVRLYLPDPEGRPELVGEDMMPHVSPGETLSLSAGRAFDIHGERVLLRESSRRVWEEDVEMTLRRYEMKVVVTNYGDRDVTVTSVESLPRADWTVETHSDHEFREIDATTVEYDLEVPAGSETTLLYTVETRSPR